MARGKRPEQRDSDEEPSQDGYFDAKRILKETVDKYLIDWEGKDEDGKPWEPSWERKEDCTSPLIKEWEALKRQKREKLQQQRAKSNETSSSHQQSVVSSKNGERTRTREKPLNRVEDVVRPTSMAPQFPAKELGRKRRRSPEPQSKIGRDHLETIDLSDSEEETRQAGVDKHTNHKRRRLDRESPEIEFQDPPATNNASYSKLISPPSKYRNTRESSSSSISEPEMTVAGPKPPTKRPPVPPVLHAIPQPSPTVFRKQLDPTPSSQIEQFSTTPEPSQPVPKTKDFRFLYYNPHGIRPTRQREPLQSRLDRAKQQAPERLKDLERMEQSEALPSKELVAEEPPEPSSKSPTKSPAKSDGDTGDAGDAGPLDESIVPSSLPEDMYVYEEMVNPDEVAEQILPQPQPQPQIQPQPQLQKQIQPQPSAPEPVQRPSTPPISPKALIRRPPSEQEPDDADLKLAAKDAMIVALEARIEMMQEDRDRMEQRLETQTRDYSLTKRNMEQQITSLTTALKQFASVVGPAGVDAVLKSSTASVPAASTSVDSLMQSPVTNTYVRSEDDDQLIRQLREENAKLQDAVLQFRADKNSSEAMLNQVRDVALRAEATKTDLSRQVRILTETAKNAPKIAEELYQSQLVATEEELDKLKTQIEILSEQNQRTNDYTRKKAAKSDTFSLKYMNLKARHERLYEELSAMEDERDNARAEFEVAKTMIERLGGVAPSREDLQQLLSMVNNDGSESGASSLPMFFKDDEHNGHEATSEENEDSSEESESVPPENAGPTLVVEEVMSGMEPVFDPPNLVMEDDLIVHEESQIQANGSTQSTTSTNLKPAGAEDSEDLVWLCFWHATEDSCTDRFISKGDLVAHVLGTHLRL